MSGRLLEPPHPSPALSPAAEQGLSDDLGRVLDNPVWRHALQLAARAERPRGRRPAPGGRVRGALLLVGVALASLASGIYIGGSGLLPADLAAWQQLLAQAAPWDDAAARDAPALAVGATLLQAAGSAPTTRPPATIAVPVAEAALGASVPAAAQPPPRIPTPPLPTDGAVATLAAAALPTPLSPGVAAAASPALALAAGPTAASAAPAAEPVAVAAAPPSAAYRIQLALLRDPRHADPVWQSFRRALGARTAGLERFMEITRTQHGLRHLLQAGPLPDAAAAAAMCERVLATGGDCLVVPPS